MWLFGPLLFWFTFGQPLVPLARELAGEVKPFAGRTAREWTSLLKRGTDADVNRAINALTSMGVEARVAVPTMKEVFEHGPPWQRRNAALGLGALGGVLPEARDALRQGLHNPNMTIRRAALDGMARLDPAAVEKMAPDLLDLLDEQFFRFRRNVTDVLGRADLTPEKHLDLLLRMLRHSRSEVQRIAITAFRKPPRHAAYVQHLLPLLKDYDSEVRRRVMQVLCQYAGEEQAPSSYLVQGLQSEDEDIREAALAGMVALGAKAQPLESELLTALEQATDLEIRLSLGEGLWRCCRHVRGKEAVLAVYREGSVGLRLQAVNLLAELGKGQETTLEILRALLLGKKVSLERLPTKPYVLQEAAILPMLEEALRDKQSEVRHKAQDILRDMEERPRAVALLLQCCRADADPVVVFRAALILWTRDNHPAGAEYLALFLNDEAISQAQRRVAFRHVAITGPLGVRAVPHLLAALRSPEANLREWAALRLEGCTVALPAVVDGLGAALVDKDRDVREAAVRTLRSLGPAAQSSVPDLLRRLDDDDSRVQREAILSLAALHSEPGQLVPRLVLFLSHHEEQLRLAALEALIRMGPASRPALPVVRNLLRDREYSPRKKAVDFLARLDLSDDEAATLLAPVLHDAEDDIRSQAALLLAPRQQLPPAVMAQLRQMLLRDEGRARLAAAFAVWNQDRQPFAFAVLRNGLKDFSPDSCTFAIDCLTQLGPDARPALPLLRQLLRHKDTSLADAARDALWQLAPPFFVL